MVSPEFCRKCRSEVSIPGLDSSRCPVCGWVESLERLQVLQREASRKRKRGKDQEDAA